VSRVQAIEDQVRELSGPEVRELRAWLDEFEAQLFEDRIAADSKMRKFDSLIERALADERNGKTTYL